MSFPLDRIWAHHSLHHIKKLYKKREIYQDFIKLRFEIKFHAENRFRLNACVRLAISVLFWEEENDHWSRHHHSSGN
jgi:hypothetical protein